MDLDLECDDCKHPSVDHVGRVVAVRLVVLVNEAVLVALVGLELPVDLELIVALVNLPVAPVDFH